MDYPLEHDLEALQEMEVPLRADRWWSYMGEQAEDPDQGRSASAAISADNFPSLNLPPLPSDRSRLDVHTLLSPMHIAHLLRRLKVVIM